MLKRMWSGDLTKEDWMRINTRVLGTNSLELPPEFEGMQISNIFNFGMYCFSLIKSKHVFSFFQGDACYACPTNKERNSIHAAIFKEHIV